MKKAIIYLIVLLSPTILSAQLDLVKEIYPGWYENADPYICGALNNGKVLFFATDNKNNRELWVTDGTASGTRIVVDQPNTGILNFAHIIAGDKMYYLTEDLNYGRETWVSDGTSAGTHILKDIWPGKKSSVAGAERSMFMFNNKIYFAAVDSAHGSELWVTDGTEAGTRMLKDIYTGTSSSSPADFHAAFGYLYFVAIDSTHGREIWRTDGTSAGTQIVADVFPGKEWGVTSSGNRTFITYGNKLFFSGRNSKEQGWELYSFDGINTSLVKDIWPGDLNSSNPSVMTIAGGKLFFKAEEYLHGSELWVTDGTAAGTKIAKDMTPGLTGTALVLLGELDGKLLLDSGGISGAHILMLSDGTPSGTYNFLDSVGAPQVTKAYVRSEQEHLAGLIKANYIHENKFYYSGLDNDGENLWVTDGTVQGTKKINYTGPTLPIAIYLPEINWITIADNKAWVSYSNNGSLNSELCMYPIPPSSVNRGEIQDLSISPNPNNGSFLLQLDNRSFSSGSLVITDVSGKVVYSQSVLSGSRHIAVHIIDACPGIYFAKLKMDDTIMNCKIFIK